MCIRDRPSTGSPGQPGQALLTQVVRAERDILAQVEGLPALRYAASTAPARAPAAVGPGRVGGRAGIAQETRQRFQGLAPGEPGRDLTDPFGGLLPQARVAQQLQQGLGEGLDVLGRHRRPEPLLPHEPAEGVAVGAHDLSLIHI